MFHWKSVPISVHITFLLVDCYIFAIVLECAIIIGDRCVGIWPDCAPIVFLFMSVLFCESPYVSMSVCRVYVTVCMSVCLTPLYVGKCSVAIHTIVPSHPAFQLHFVLFSSVAVYQS